MDYYDNSRSFISRLEMAMNYRGVSVPQLCEMADGVTRQNINSWKNGSSPRLDKAKAVALALDVSLDFLAGTVDEMDGHFISEEHQKLVHGYDQMDKSVKHFLLTALYDCMHQTRLQGKWRPALPIDEIGMIDDDE